MGSIQLFENYNEVRRSDFEHPSISKYSALDVVYVVEYDESHIKIGYTDNLKRRMQQLNNEAKRAGINLGRIAATGFTEHGRDKEREAHQSLSRFRIGRSEMFMTDFLAGVGALEGLRIVSPTHAELKKMQADAEKKSAELVAFVAHVTGLDEVVEPPKVGD